MEIDSTSGPSSTPDASSDVQGARPYPGTPQWVKVFGALALAVAVAFVFLRFTIGMHHG